MAGQFAILQSGCHMLKWVWPRVGLSQGNIHYEYHYTTLHFLESIVYRPVNNAPVVLGQLLGHYDIDRSIPGSALQYDDIHNTFVYSYAQLKLYT